jgi:hypothetical protein
VAEHVFNVQDVLGLVVLHRAFEVSERPECYGVTMVPNLFL